MKSVVSFEDAQALATIDPELQDAISKVGQLDLAPLRVKFAHWSDETFAEVEDLYRKFLALNLRYQERKLCPNGPIDELWHAHILDTRKYAEDCRILFGGPLHHFPYFGLRGDKSELDQAFADTVDLFIQHFGIDPTAGDATARSCRPQKCP